MRIIFTNTINLICLVMNESCSMIILWFNPVMYRNMQHVESQGGSLQIKCKRYITLKQNGC